jgi:hypothetical protein
MASPDDDRVLAQRERARVIAAALQRWGTIGYAIAVVGFVAAAIASFPGWSIPVIVTALVIGSILLAPGIVLGFGVRAAEREDREQGRS